MLSRKARAMQADVTSRTNELFHEVERGRLFAGPGKRLPNVIDHKPLDKNLLGDNPICKAAKGNPALIMINQAIDRLEVVPGKLCP